MFFVVLVVELKFSSICRWLEFSQLFQRFNFIFALAPPAVEWTWYLSLLHVVTIVFRIILFVIPEVPPSDAHWKLVVELWGDAEKITTLTKRKNHVADTSKRFESYTIQLHYYNNVYFDSKTVDASNIHDLFCILTPPRRGRFFTTTPILKKENKKKK